MTGWNCQAGGRPLQGSSPILCEQPDGTALPQPDRPSLHWRIPEDQLVGRPGASLDLVSVWSTSQGSLGSPSLRWRYLRHVNRLLIWGGGPASRWIVRLMITLSARMTAWTPRSSWQARYWHAGRMAGPGELSWSVLWR